MKLFTPILNFIDASIVNYSSQKAQLVAQLIEPAVYTGIGLYFAIQGYRHMKGVTDQPVMEFVDSVVKIGCITTLALNVGEYNPIIVDTFQNSPIILANAMSERGVEITSLSASMGDTLDKMGANVVDVGMSFWSDAGPTAPGFYLLGLICWIVGFAVLTYTTFLMLLGKIGIAIVLGLGPLFISSLLWESTKGYFSNFLNLLINFGLVIVLAFANTSLITTMFAQTAADLAAEGAEAKVVSIIALAVTGALSIMLLRQVKETASSLAGGVSLSTLGMGTAAAKGGWNKVTNKHGRELQRRATDDIEIEKRKAAIRTKEGRLRGTSSGSVERTEPRKELRYRSGTSE